mmetsp:Transcript_102277/g.293438  ORF Transcript_102277/g.293438 Transcript_102277/m.293438 type:complete len:268 (+) Transcript_102277:821-1624(+)
MDAQRLRHILEDTATCRCDGDIRLQPVGQRQDVDQQFREASMQSLQDRIELRLDDTDVSRWVLGGIVGGAEDDVIQPRQDRQQLPLILPLAGHQCIQALRKPIHLSRQPADPSASHGRVEAADVEVLGRASGRVLARCLAWLATALGSSDEARAVSLDEGAQCVGRWLHPRREAPTSEFDTAGIHHVVPGRHAVANCHDNVDLVRANVVGSARRMCPAQQRLANSAQRLHRSLAERSEACALASAVRTVAHAAAAADSTPRCGPARK